MIMRSNLTNADAVVNFTFETKYEDLPADVLNSARLCLVDWFGVALGSANEAAVKAIKRTIRGWNAEGGAPILLDGTTTPTAAALVNGTMAHCLDFDDTHVGSIAHLSGPIWAAAFAVGSHLGSSPRDIITAFIIGFEVGGRLGSGGFGVAINERHIHSTGVFGCIGAAVAAGALYRLNGDQLKIAIGLAATQVSGLTGSFGTTAKPFHAGKAAFNGVLAAEMAREGYHGASDMIETDGGLARALVQDRAVSPQQLVFTAPWEINQNTFKPYASCLLTHPSIDAARELNQRLGGRSVKRITVKVDPLCIQLAGIPDPKTPFEGKFSLAFCTSLALQGRVPSQLEFTSDTLQDYQIQKLVGLVDLVAVKTMEKTAATVDVHFSNGETDSCHVPLARGNPGRPLSWDDMRNKFISLVRPVLVEKTEDIFEQFRSFDLLPDMAKLHSALAGAAPAE
jgi:2-methylcitrate dehydratase PrpD